MAELFNDIPIHSVFIWGDGLQFIKLSNAIPNVPMRKQAPNCFDLQKHHYCVMSAKHKVKIVKTIDQYDDSRLDIE